MNIPCSRVKQAPSKKHILVKGAQSHPPFIQPPLSRVLSAQLFVHSGPGKNHAWIAKRHINLFRKCCRKVQASVLLSWVPGLFLQDFWEYWDESICRQKERNIKHSNKALDAEKATFEIPWAGGLCQAASLPPGIHRESWKQKSQLGPHCDARLVGRRAVSRGLKHTAFQPQSSHRLRCGLDQLLEHKCL